MKKFFHCLQCAKIFNRYPNVHAELRTWFEALQIENPDAHISSAGRGKIDQEVAFERGASKAHYGQSAHIFSKWRICIL